MTLPDGQAATLTRRALCVAGAFIGSIVPSLAERPKTNRALILDARGLSKQDPAAELPEAHDTIGGLGETGDANATKSKIYNTGETPAELHDLFKSLGGIPYTLVGLVGDGSDETTKFTAAIAKMNAGALPKRPILGEAGKFYKITSRLDFPARSGFISKDNGGFLVFAANFNRLTVNHDFNQPSGAIVSLGDYGIFEGRIVADFKDTLNSWVDGVICRGIKQPRIVLDAEGWNAGFAVRADSIEGGYFEFNVHDCYLKQATNAVQLSGMAVDADRINSIFSSGLVVRGRASKLHGDPTIAGTNIQTDGYSDGGSFSPDVVVDAFEVGEACDTLSKGGRFLVRAKRCSGAGIKNPHGGSGNLFSGILEDGAGWGLCIAGSPNANLPSVGNRSAGLIIRGHGALTKIPGPSGDTTVNTAIYEAVRIDSAPPFGGSSLCHDNVIDVDVKNCVGNPVSALLSGPGTGNVLRLRRDASSRAAQITTGAPGNTVEEYVFGVLKKTVGAAGPPVVVVSSDGGPTGPTFLATRTDYVPTAIPAGKVLGIRTQNADSAVGTMALNGAYPNVEAIGLSGVEWGARNADGENESEFVVLLSNGDAPTVFFSLSRNVFYPEASGGASIGSLFKKWKRGWFTEEVTARSYSTAAAYRDDAAAAEAGVPVGGIYRKTGGAVVWRQT